MSSRSCDSSHTADLSQGRGKIGSRGMVVCCEVHVPETSVQLAVIKGVCWFRQKSLAPVWASGKAGSSPVSKKVDFVSAFPFLSLTSSQD